MSSQVDCVELDGLVVLKIVKHCQQALPTFVTGQLLGLDIGRSLEVTNCFPFPAADRGEGADDESAEYQMEMMRCLREVNVDNNTVGWYQSTYFSSFIDEACVETCISAAAPDAQAAFLAINLCAQAVCPTLEQTCLNTALTTGECGTYWAACQ